MSTEGITFAYCGYMTENILTGVGDALKQKLESEDTDTRTIRSVFAVFVEQMQNIIRYSVGNIPSSKESPQSTDVETPRYGILTIGQEGTDYVVHSGNMIKSEDVAQIQSRLAELQNKSHEELKREYKEKLKSNTDEFKLGAGIGFIEIARRASKPIEFDFMQIDENHTFFSFKATV